VGNTGTMKRTGRVGRVNVTRKDSRNRECNQPSAAALTNGCAQEKQKTKTKTNVLDGADFVRDVVDTYPESHRELGRKLNCRKNISGRGTGRRGRSAGGTQGLT
jgi:hypothetical protein